METIYLDECGYTGEDLFNSDQPVFILASLYLSEEKCLELKKKYFSKIMAQELKHTELSRRPAQQQMIINFISDLAKNSPQAAKFSIAHKQYNLVAKIVDLIIEPVLHDSNIDLYDKGANIALTNVIYYTTPGIAGEGFFKEMIFRFQEMMRKRSKETYEQFFQLFLSDKLSPELDELFTSIKYSYFKKGFPLLNTIPLKSLDIAFSEALMLMSRWANDISGNIVLIHDESSAMAKERTLWDNLVSPDVPNITLGYDRRTWSFPLRIKKTDFMNSHNSAGLQLVDILAGAMARRMKYANNKDDLDDKYTKKLIPLLPGSFDYHVIWPSTDITPQELGTIGNNAKDPLEYFNKIAKKQYHNKGFFG